MGRLTSRIWRCSGDALASACTTSQLHLLSCSMHAVSSKALQSLQGFTRPPCTWMSVPIFPMVCGLPQQSK